MESKWRRSYAATTVVRDQSQWLGGRREWTGGRARLSERATGGTAKQASVPCPRACGTCELPNICLVLFPDSVVWLKCLFPLGRDEKHLLCDEELGIFLLGPELTGIRDGGYFRTCALRIQISFHVCRGMGPMETTNWHCRE